MAGTYVQGESFWGLSTRRLAGAAMLSAVAAAMEILPLDLRYPFAPGTTIDPVGIPIALAAILFGPSAGALSTLVAGAAIVAHGNAIGASFKVPAELATALPLVMTLYALKGGLSRGRWARGLAVAISWSVALLSRIAVMSGYNYVALQALLGIPASGALLTLPAYAVFNLLQGVINVVPAYLIAIRLPSDMKPSWLPSEGGRGEPP